MSRDGNLRPLFARHMPRAHWVSVETWSTGQGVPDTEYCFPGGRSGWIEFKAATGWKVNLSPHQVAWIERRVRAGGRAFIAVRKGNELFVYPGSEARILFLSGMKNLAASVSCAGGPTRWDWEAVEKVLTD
jgi:hypothetical protein